MTSENRSAPYYDLNNQRLALALSYLGGFFDQIRYMSSIREFRIRIQVQKNVGSRLLSNITTIASGFVRRIAEIQKQ